MTVSEIQSQLCIPSSTLSHHLEKLRVEELINSRRDKQYLWYSAKVEIAADLVRFLYNGAQPFDLSKSYIELTIKPAKMDPM